STRNTRIERLWVEVGTHFVRRWRAFFSRLERLHKLDIDRPEHLWLLHTLFLDAINADCQDFKDTWNSHPMQGENTSYKSPNDLRFMGQARFGVYKDECEGIHPDTIDKYYGVDHGTEIRHRTGHGAGHPIDEAESDSELQDVSAQQQERLQPSPEELAQQIADNQTPQVRHEGVSVVQGRNPFHDENTEAAFFDVLGQVIESDIIPVGYGVHPDEWINDAYPTAETMKIGSRGTKEIQILLDDKIWEARARLWAQGLNVISHFFEL
ncbi:hypothetical protein BDZ97DRAFT_1666643, partial [Flammula alnicola]